MAHDIRVPPVEPGTRPELAEMEALILKERFGEIPLLYKVLLNSPAITQGWEQLLTQVRKHTTVSPALREMIILRIAVINKASFEFAAHEPHARAAGVGDTEIDALGADPMPQGVFDARTALVLELTDRMTRDVQVPKALMDRLTAEADAQEVVEIVATIAVYNMVSRFLVALNITH